MDQWPGIEINNKSTWIIKIDKGHTNLHDGNLTIEIEDEDVDFEEEDFEGEETDFVEEDSSSGDVDDGITEENGDVETITDNEEITDNNDHSTIGTITETFQRIEETINNRNITLISNKLISTTAIENVDAGVAERMILTDQRIVKIVEEQDIPLTGVNGTKDMKITPQGF